MKPPWMNDAGRGAAKARRRVRPSLESMERREVPAGVMLGVNGVLTITATSDAKKNYATVDLDTKGTKNPFDDVVMVNWTYGKVGTPTKSYPRYKQANVFGAIQWVENVKEVDYFGNAGNDDVTNRTAIPCKLYGNDGDDGLIGGDGDDVIEGGKGSDYIDGRGGGDVLYASSYADLLGGATGMPPASHDTVVGDAGMDWIAGARNGVNTLSGGADGDWVYGADFAVNHIEGGPGNDYLAGGALSFNTIVDRSGVDTIQAGKALSTSIWCDDGDSNDTIEGYEGYSYFIVCDQPGLQKKGDKLTFAKK